MKKRKTHLDDMESLEVAKFLSHVALDKKAQDLIIIDVKANSSFADYFVIMSGRSTRHVQGLANAIDRELTKKRLKSTITEGLQDGLWVLLDYNDVIVHVFYHETRQFYDIEGLWHKSPRIPIEE